MRRSWKRLHEANLSFMQTAGRLHSGATDVRPIDRKAVLQGLPELFAELDARLGEARRLLAGEASGRRSRPVSLALDRQALAALDHFERAAVEVARSELEALGVQTETMLECLRDIGGVQQAELVDPGAVDDKEPRGPFGLPPLDHDQLRAGIITVISMWVGALLWIYVNPPGHVSWFQFIPNLTLAALRTPHVRFFPLKMFAYSYVVGMVVYVFLMPHLSGFAELGTLIFAFSFLTVYYFPKLSPILFMAMFTMFGISNQQTYDFASMMNSYLFTMAGIAVVYALTYLIGSPRPEKVFLKQTRRFFRSCQYLVSHEAKPKTFVQRAAWAYHLQELRSLPGKMAIWGKQINPQSFPENSTEQVTHLVAGLQLLAYRVEDLLAVRSERQAELLVRELGEDMRAWRLVVDQAFGQWSAVPEADPGTDLHQRVSERLAKLNARIEELSKRARPDEVGAAETRSFYRLLGAFRNLTQAGVRYADQARHIDWADWREERFE
jgi:hypothetical protein